MYNNISIHYFFLFDYMEKYICQLMTFKFLMSKFASHSDLMKSALENMYTKDSYWQKITFKSFFYILKYNEDYCNIAK